MDQLVVPDQRYFTGVGHRDVKHFFVTLASYISEVAVKKGYKLRTGDAIGMDHGFRSGTKAHQRDVYSAKKLPWAIHGPSCNNWDDALAIAGSIHPNWGVCTPYVKALHARNVFQVLGEDINTPSDFLVCYARPVDEERTMVKGGTNTTYQIARDWNIPIFNLFYRDDYVALCQYLNVCPKELASINSNNIDIQK